jgi:hypothetical protein
MLDEIDRQSGSLEQLATDLLEPPMKSLSFRGQADPNLPRQADWPETNC